MPSPDASPRVLLVEGQDDHHVVRHIRERAGRIVDFAIRDKDGVDQLLDSIRTEVRAPGREVVGIVADANDDPSARWEAVQGRLRRAELTPPPDIDQSGLIIEGSPRVGVWLMPDNASPGSLEDFVARMIPDEDPVWPLAQDYIAGIPEADREFSERNARRAEVHAWLATREKPGQMGLAIGAVDLDVEAAICQTFVGWLRSLFGEASP